MNNPNINRSAAKAPLIEVLCPELGNLYGDSGNVLYLKKCLPEADFRMTHLTDRPAFVSETPDLIVMGSMSEHSQQEVIKRLLPYRERLNALVEAGVTMLFTGNAGEVLFTALLCLILMFPLRRLILGRNTNVLVLKSAPAVFTKS